MGSAVDHGLDPCRMRTQDTVVAILYVDSGEKGMVSTVVPPYI